MTSSSDLDPRVLAWFEDGPSVMPDRVIDVVATSIAAQRQRRAWPFPRRTTVNVQLKVVAALAAALVVAIVGYNLLPGRLAPGGPTAAPTTSPVAATPAASNPSGSPAAYVCEEGTGCAGLLEAGDGHTRQFDVPFTYTTPAGWMNPIDLPTLFALTPVDHPADVILVWSGAVPAEQTATCTLRAKPGASTTVSGWMAYLDAHPGLDATNAQTLSITQHPTKSMDVRSLGGWTSPCPSDRTDLNVPLLKTPDGAPGDGYGVRSGTQARIYAIAVANQTLIVTVDAYGGTDQTFAAATELAQPIINSFFFATP